MTRKTRPRVAPRGWGNTDSDGILYHEAPPVGLVEDAAMKPGEYLLDAAPIELNAGRATATVQVNNTGDRPIQVGSHFHFFEVNRALVFDRAAAYGMRLDLPSGTGVRFEPGDVKTVQLVAL